MTGTMKRGERSTSSLIVENTAEMIAVWENICLVREIGTTRVDEIDTRQAWQSQYTMRRTHDPYIWDVRFS